MTKTFEEEHIKFNNEYGNCKSAYYQKAVRHHFKDWHSDEEFQEMKESYWNQAESILSMLEEIKSLKSQLQQQALPVVPECVAEYIEGCKRSDCGLIWAIRPDRDASDNSEKVYDWLFPNGVKLPNGTFPNPYEPDNLVRPDKENQIKFVRAWLDGYTVEKPQLFYLKNKLTGLWLIRYEIVDKVYPYDHTSDIRNRDTFTQQEIDSMQTGSYEKIEVTE